MKNAYASPAAFDRALKDAAKNFPGDTSAAYRQALRDRFLCRVFWAGNSNFVLKGGSGLLARIPDGRATRDVDFSTMSKISAAQAIAEIKEIAAHDLGDWCDFRFVKCEESVDENGYSRLLKLKFTTFVGATEKDPILIDLSLDCETTLPPERISPANRIAVKGVKTCDYIVYSLPDQIADKFCAIMERQQNGHPSSRMKDLLDVVVYLTHESFVLGQVKDAIVAECCRRNMEVPENFSAPSFWESNFENFSAKNLTNFNDITFENANELAKSFFDPVLDNKSNLRHKWDPARKCWG